MKKVRLILAGAGERGMSVYGDFVHRNPDMATFIAIAETDRNKRERFGDIHAIPQKYRFSSWEDMLEMPRIADALLICTQDRMHYLPAVKGLAKGYHVLLEKPMSVNPVECIQLGRTAKQYDRILAICHVLRYTPFFSKIKELIDTGRIGRVMSIQLNENVAYWHMAHSYVRGNWGNSQKASPMILAKSCHDMDILNWLAGAACVKLSSFGELSFFKKENAPTGASDRCISCKVEQDCPFSAIKQYLGTQTCWPVSAISLDTTYEARLRAVKEGPYGRCVFHCDNNVVDHQVVNMEFDNKITAVFTMTGFTHDNNRTIRIMGTAGDIRGSMNDNEIIAYDFASDSEDRICISNNLEGGHGGGDEGLMKSFIRHVFEDRTRSILSSADESIHSHLMAFAAEEARLNSCVVLLKEFEEKYKD